MGLREENVYALTIKTPYGPSRCMGKVNWTEQDGSGETLGIEFTQLATEENDPLRLLMDSPLC